MIYLLDSNVWIGLMRRSSAVLAARFQAMAPDELENGIRKATRWL